MIALKVILPRQPDIILSGINLGPNLGADVTYSGTVAAALEGTLLGIKSVAVSLDTRVKTDFSSAAKISEKIVYHVLKHGLPPETLLNVNIPLLPYAEIKGMRITQLGRRIYNEGVIAKQDPRGREYYWIGGEEPGFHLEAGTDFEAMEHGEVSITPLHFDSTNHSVLGELETWLANDLTL